MEKVLRKMLAFPLVLALSAGLSACENPVEDEHEDHPVGLVVTDAQGAEVARFVVGAGATGQISVPLGTPQTFTVAAVGEDGDEIAIGGEIGLQIAAAPAFAGATLQGNQLVVTGTQAGTGNLEIFLLHDEHQEFRAVLPLTVAG